MTRHIGHLSFWLASRVFLENKWFLHIFLRSLQRSETGIKGKLKWSWLRSAIAWGIVLFENKRSCVWRTSWDISAEEITMVVTWPSFISIIGPCILPSLANDCCGLFARLIRFAIIVRGDQGPGGSLWFGFLLLTCGERTIIAKHVNRRSSIVIAKSISDGWRLQVTTNNA